MSAFGQQPRLWTPEELAILEQRVSEGARCCDIARELNRNQSSVFERLRRGKARAPKAAGQVPDRVPAHVQEERARRINAPHRDLTGWMLGDPPVGFSALERRA